MCARALMALEPLIHPRCLPPANAFTEMVAGRSMNGASSYLPKTNKSGHHDNGAFGGSSIKIGHLSVDLWAVVDTWLGYGEDEDDIISHSERNNSLLDGAANGIPAERMTSANGTTSRSLGADRSTFDEATLSEPIRNELVEDPMQTDTEIVVPDNITPVVCVSNEECHDAPESRVDDSLSKQGDDVQTPSATNVEETPSQGLELRNSQPGVTEGDLVTVSRDIVTSTSVTTLGPVNTSQGNQEASLESKTVVMESVEVTTTTVLAAEHKPTSPKVVYEIGSDSDSDGPLPAIVDGDPDSESD